MACDPDRVRAASAAWVWIPEGSVEVRRDTYRLIRYPERFWGPGSPAALVAWSRDDHVTATDMDEVLARVKEWGLPHVSWWVSDATAATESALRERGGRVVETVEVLAHDLTGAEPVISVPQDVSVELVADESTLRVATAVRTEGWEQPIPDEAQFADDLAQVLRVLEDWSEFRVLARIEGQPVAVGGCEIADGVARLWGAVTLAGWRGRGAYRGVLAERLRLARRHGADMALVKGRVQSSAPILIRAGFTSHGSERRYQLPVAL